MQAWRCHWERREQTARSDSVREWARNEYSRYRKKKAIERNCVLRLLRPTELHPAGSAYPTRPATIPIRCSDPAQSAILSRWFQIAQQYARDQIRTAARTSAGCSNCARTAAQTLSDQRSLVSTSRSPI